MKKELDRKFKAQTELIDTLWNVNEDEKCNGVLTVMN